jgi:Tol biopolymer transport system component
VILDDGPEYWPDGAFIYFNSERTGQMQIWRMKPDGSAEEPASPATRRIRVSNSA